MISPSNWKPTDGITLEPNAYKAATSDEGSVIVAAGPGAGKTEMLAQRADYLLRTGICPYPRRILAISFKVDAARNLQERVRKRSGAKHAKRFDSLTFHAFAKRIIDNYRPALTGPHTLNPRYVVGEEADFPNAIGYKNMVPLATEILRTNSYALHGLRQTYTHIFFDEFQDVTSEQYELLVTAFGETSAQLTAVGDTKQRIMAFAGALDVMSRDVVLAPARNDTVPIQEVSVQTARH